MKTVISYNNKVWIRSLNGSEKGEGAMKALRKYESGVKKFRLEDISLPDPLDHEVQVRIVYAGICGSDLHIYHDTYADAPPMTIGHEFSAVITKVGTDVQGFSVGDYIVAETNAEYCGDCVLCKKGRFCLCDDRKAIGQKTDGVFAEYANLRASNLHHLPKTVSMKEAALAEPLSCVVHAVMERSTILAGDTVLVSGPGPIGLMTMMLAKKYGAQVILAGTTMDASRLALGKELGADVTVDVLTKDLEKVVQEYTSGRGIDVVLECSGAAPAVNTGLKVLRKLGTFTQIGLFGDTVPVNINDICYKEINYQGCLSKTNWSWRRTVELLESRTLPLDRLISHLFTLDKWEEAFSIADRKEGNKIVFSIGSEGGDA